MSELAQAGILRPIPALGRYLMFSVAQPAALPEALRRLAEVAQVASGAVVVGLGPQLTAALDRALPGLHEFPALSAPGIAVPSTPVALLCWLRGEGGDAGDLVLFTRRLEKALAPALRLDQALDAFRHGLGESGHGRDLTGYEDGTENPEGEAAAAAALVQGQGAGQDGASFMALQQWQHDFDAFEALSAGAQDHVIGRRRSDNEELGEAHASAHVKRTAQESFEPEAFVLRRSMPWAAGAQAGLVFVAFGRSFDAFEAQLRRMLGLDDGIADALFRISRPLSGAYFWCPPVRGGRLDLSALGL
ncbi:Dyp-type peroxidase [Ramlibacter sp. 2FC]|uniref:Dyp-type peroxidase n=1 Tax=Ramlibacter sp. 2FC TaxID=2502188 RepID=UPI0010F8B719|nr:Dyp-type peroxidase [Ramlibacter sp. 2FC]